MNVVVVKTSNVSYLPSQLDRIGNSRETSQNAAYPAHCEHGVLAGIRDGLICELERPTVQSMHVRCIIINRAKTEKKRKCTSSCTIGKQKPTGRGQATSSEDNKTARKPPRILKTRNEWGSTGIGNHLAKNAVESAQCVPNRIEVDDSDYQRAILVNHNFRRAGNKIYARN